MRGAMWNGSQQMSGGDGFFQFDDADNYLLEDSREDYQASMDMTAQCCLCKCGHKKDHLEASNALKFRSYQGYLPEIEEEMSMPFSYNPRRDEISPPSDEEFSYIAYPQSSRGRGRNARDKEEESMSLTYSLRRSESSLLGDEDFSYIAYPQNSRGRGRNTLDNDLEFGFSDPSSLGRRSSVSVPYLSLNNDQELMMGGNISESFQRMDLEKDHLMISSPSHFTLQTRPRDERKMLVYTPGKLRRSSQEKFDIYDGRAALVDPMSDSRNLRHQVTQSPGFDVQYFRNNHGILVPTIIQSKQGVTSNSASELPLSSSVSVSSDETEHPQIKVGLYKTELCRSWEETGYCRYGTKCQFAHGNDDLRPVPRHPKYKTELCRSYTETGLCSYGKRCRFIHKQDSPSSSDLEKKGSRRLSIFQKLCTGASENLPPRQP
ncbi:hypothetical protein M758_6G180800 [Ceratodon purpureus]|nr:hypothetical protein M758_6G180800 [Ceratodon purpureus]